MFWSTFSGPTDRGVTPNMVCDDDPVPTREEVSAWLDRKAADFMAHLKSAWAASPMSEHIKFDFQQTHDSLRDGMADSISEDTWRGLE